MSRFVVRTTRGVGVTAALAGVIALSGCTSSSPSGPGSAVPSGPGLTAVSPLPSDSGTSSAVSASAAPSRTPTKAPSSTASSASPKPKPKPKPSPTGPPTCTSAQLSVRVLRGGAVAGAEIALITFTNTSASTCSMFGFPGVSLRLHNALLGAPAQRTAKKPQTVPLARGAAAEAMITDVSSCQAPVSDTVRVYAPDQTAFVDKPLEMRGCRLFIDPVRPGS